jgi:hypothetical protein
LARLNQEANTLMDEILKEWEEIKWEWWKIDEIKMQMR